MEEPLKQENYSKMLKFKAGAELKPPTIIYRQTFHLKVFFAFQRKYL
jgi:hypothetical protein